MTRDRRSIAMLCLHSSPVGPLGTRDTGGMSVYVRHLAAGLADRGYRVDLFTATAGSGGQPVRRLHPNVRLVHLPVPGGPVSKTTLHAHLPDLVARLEAFRAADPVRYDLVHSHYWLSGVAGAQLQQAWAVPHWVTFHTLGAVKGSLGCGENEPDLRLRSEREVARTCDGVVAFTDAERDHLVRLCGADPHRVAVVPCGVDRTRFRPVDRDRTRHDLGLPLDRPVILFVGRFAPVKGVDRLLEAVAGLGRGNRALLVLVGGDGPGDPVTAGLTRKAASLGIGDRVRFVGTVAQGELVSYYGSADLLVLPSHYESFGLVMLEALACGTPVVSTPVGAARDVLHPNISGEVAEDFSPDTMARCIESVLDRRLTGKFCPETVRSAVAGYGWDRMAATVSGVYAGTYRTPAPTNLRTERTGDGTG